MNTTRYDCVHPTMRTAVILMAVALFVSGCATYRSPEFEKSAVTAHSALNSFLIEYKNQNSPISYKDVVKQYNDIEGKMGDMVFAAYLVDNNAKTIQIAENIRGDFVEMRKTHQDQGTASPSFFARKYQGYEILFLDLTKAEGSKPDKPKWKVDTHWPTENVQKSFMNQRVLSTVTLARRIKVANDIDSNKLTSDIVNAVASHIIKGSVTLVSYEQIHAKMLAAFTAAIADDINNNRITEAEARNLMRMQETVEATHMLAKDIIKDSTTSKAVLALMKVVQDAFNAATGLSIGIFWHGLGISNRFRLFFQHRDVLEKFGGGGQSANECNEWLTSASSRPPAAEA